MADIQDKVLTGERALYAIFGKSISNCTFEDGESPLKECKDISVENSAFRWKYPLWYDKNVTVRNCVWEETARAGVWYTDNIRIENSKVNAPKNFRRCNGLYLSNVEIPHAEETLWQCENVTISNVKAAGNYFAMNCQNVEAHGLEVDGNYAFDGAKNITIRNSRLMTKDAFWNCENVTVYDSVISGEYLGWNSRNLTFVNCTLESTQGLCYIQNLKLVNCRLENTTLAFEFSTVDADIADGVESVLNPSGGTIRAKRIGELIIEQDRVDKSKTKIICKDVAAVADRPEWLREREI